MGDMMQEMIDTLQQLKAMHQMCFELLEQLNVICDYIDKKYPEAVHDEKLKSLLSKTIVLYNELDKVKKHE